MGHREQDQRRREALRKRPGEEGEQSPHAQRRQESGGLAQREADDVRKPFEKEDRGRSAFAEQGRHISPFPTRSVFEEEDNAFSRNEAALLTKRTPYLRGVAEYDPPFWELFP